MNLLNLYKLLYTYKNPLYGGKKRCSRGSRRDPITQKCMLTKTEQNKKNKILENAGVYAPPKYFEGLNAEQTKKRLKRIKEGSKTRSDDKNAYREFETDYDESGNRIQTKLSGYTKQWKKHFPNANSLEEKSKVTGVPMKNIQKVYDKGLAAWRTGHRPGANPQQWGYARVHSFLVKGKTFYTADRAQALDAIKTSKNAKKWFDSVNGLCDTSKNRKKYDWCKKSCNHSKLLCT